MNAVHNALAPIGVKHVEMPATPLNVWQSIQGAQRAAAE
jgi:carbon-monoxide dehydrogenase large subunit